MKIRLLILGAAAVASLWGQRVTGTRSADIRGGGGEGKCTLEVWVDDVAEVEIRGRSAVIRTINGAPASFRRFECNQAMPNNPSGFRFKGIDGRGRQALLREPGYGPAVIRIEDSKGGAEGYTFDIFWAGGGGYGGGYGGGGYNGGGYGQGGWNNGWGNGSGWINNGAFNFEGGRRGAGSFVDRNGQRRRLDAARVQIGQSGGMAVAFQSENGTIAFRGNVERRDGRRLYSRVNGSGMYGLMEIEMSSHNTVRRIVMNDVGLSWFN